MQIANCLQPVRQRFGLFKPRQQNNMVHLARLSVFLINGADFSRDDEPGGKIGTLDPAGLRKAVAQAVKPFLRWYEHFPELLTPCRMGKVPRAD